MKVFKIINLKKILKVVIFFLVLATLLILSKQNFNSVKLSVNLFISSVLPSLFPFILFTEIVLKTDTIEILSKIFGNIFSKFFKVNKNCSLAIIIGFICGFPMGSKAVNTLYSQNKISYQDAKALLSFVNNCNPAFILSTIGIGILFNLKIGIILLISHILSSIIIGFMYSRKHLSNIIHEKDTFLNSFNKKSVNIDRNIKINNDFFGILKQSILNTFKTLANILGFIIIFNLLYNILYTFLIKFNINTTILSILSGIFEITKGCADIYAQDISFTAKIIIVSILLGFSGLCINFQIFSTLNDIKYKFSTLIKNKSIHGILSGIITYILIKFNFICDESSLVFSSIDYTKTENIDYMSNLKQAYLVSTFFIIFILIIYYAIHKIRLKKSS